jgi:hypothetical protein
MGSTFTYNPGPDSLLQALGDERTELFPLVRLGRLGQVRLGTIKFQDFISRYVCLIYRYICDVFVLIYPLFNE